MEITYWNSRLLDLSETTCTNMVRSFQNHLGLLLWYVAYVGHVTNAINIGEAVQRTFPVFCSTSNIHKALHTNLGNVLKIGTLFRHHHRAQTQTAEKCPSCIVHEDICRYSHCVIWMRHSAKYYEHVPTLYWNYRMVYSCLILRNVNILVALFSARIQKS